MDNPTSERTYGELCLRSTLTYIKPFNEHKFILATYKQRTQNGAMHVVNIFGKDSGAAYGSISDGLVALGLDPRFCAQRVFQNMDKALEFAKSYLTEIARVNTGKVQAEFEEVDMSSGLYVPNSSVIANMPRRDRKN